jgi:hypothetical protein
MRTRTVAHVSALFVAVAGAGTAAAASAAPKAGTDPLVAVELSYLQIDKQALLAKLKQGQTLAQIATAQGKSPQGLIDALVAATKAKLDARVRAGKLSAAKEPALVAKTRTNVGKLVAKSFGADTKVPSVYMKPVLSYLQIDEPTLRQELKGGKTLGQIAVAHGKTAAGLAGAIVGTIQAQLDEQVTAGKLAPADRDALLAQAQSSVAKLVAGTA